MIAELGLAALWLAAALSMLQLVAGALGQRENSGELATLVRPAAIIQGVLAGISFVMLLWLFARTDLSVKLVAMNSHSDKPLVFKLAGAWGNHEGSMLLWVTVMALAGALIAAAEERAAAAESRVAELQRYISQTVPQQEQQQPPQQEQPQQQHRWFHEFSAACGGRHHSTLKMMCC